jgi:hypothetical protein
MEYMLRMRTAEGVEQSTIHHSKRTVELQYEKLRLRLEKSSQDYYELLLLEREEYDDAWEVLRGRLSGEDLDEEPDDDESDDDEG